MMDACPDAELIEVDGALYFKLPSPESGYVHLGIVPEPRGALQTFIYHLCNGILMQYPLTSILLFSWRNRHSFDEDREVIEADLLSGCGKA